VESEPLVVASPEQDHSDQPEEAVINTTINTSDHNTSDHVEIHEGEIMDAGNGIQQPVVLPTASDSQPISPKQPKGELKVLGKKASAKGEIVPVLPTDANEFEVYKSMNVAGIRPIAATSLHIVGSYDSAGHRPIGADEFEVSATINVSGLRPIAASHLHITDHLTGNRPVASNEIDDSATLMGYID
jgi:hypothetical protein